jgi:hypothetical protein
MLRISGAFYDCAKVVLHILCLTFVKDVNDLQ